MLKIKKQGLTFDDVLLIPQRTSVASRADVDLSTQLTPKITLQIPIVSANMDTVTESRMALALARAGGIGIIHRFLSIDDQVAKVTIVKKENLLVGAAIGIKDDYKERTHALLDAGADVIVLDIAHGHSEQMINALQGLVKDFPNAEFIAGNVATGDATRDLIAAGAAAIKVGIGPGALCTTRIVAGSGVPQLTAIDECAQEAKGKAPIIADGGIKASGDIAKAIAVGASTVMIGGLFAGCEESPAVTFYRNNRKYKLTRGMASLMANAERQLKDKNVKKDLESYAAEGVEAVVPYRGSAQSLIDQLVSGVRSGFSYSGAHSVAEMWEKSEFVQITSASLTESHPHDVNVL